MKKILSLCLLLSTTVAGTTAIAQERPLSPSPLYQSGWFAGPSEPYLRLGIGYWSSDISNGYWAPPGFDKPVDPDPLVFYDLSEPDGVSGTVAIGRNLRSGRSGSGGVRGELALNFFEDKDVAGPWSYTVPTTSGPHADMSTSLRSTALMGNLFYDLPQMGGDDLGFTPYVMGGVGVSWNKMGNWSRTRDDVPPSSTDPLPVRTFDGDTEVDLAWTLGIGAAWTVGSNEAGPIKLDVMYQYLDLGNAMGSAFSDDGRSQPVTPLNFDVKSQVVTVGVRIPLNLR